LLRCIIYFSVATEEWPKRQLDELQKRVSENNVGNKITGFLLFQHGRFIQLLEGADLIVEGLFATIAADPRHHTMVKLLDCLVDKRAFPAWDTGLPSLAKPAYRRQQSQTGDLGRADYYLTKPQLKTPPLLDLMDSSVGRMLTGLLRVKPVQIRAVETVDRLIAAAETVILQQGPDKVTLQAVAAEAELTHQATYRYFKNAGDILRVVIKRRQALSFKKIIEIFWIANFTSEADVASFVVSFAFGTYLQEVLVPRKIKMYLIAHYHDIAFSEIWKLAEAIHAAMARCNILRPKVGVVEIAAGLAAIAGALKLMMIREELPVDQAQTHPMLVRIFLSALDNVSVSRPLDRQSAGELVF
jgi:AcrR family transcriptional regulator